jgi:hypothetical protein
MLYAFFWVIPRRLNFMCRRFRTLCLFHLPPSDGTECSETTTYKIHTSGNYPEESIQEWLRITSIEKQEKLKFWTHLSLHLLKDLLPIYITIYPATLALRREQIQWNLDPSFLRGSVGANIKCIGEMRKQKIKFLHFAFERTKIINIKMYV